MTTEELITKYSRLYHMAESGTWESIKEHGLLSTVALLDLFEITGERRTRLIRARRPEPETISHSIHGVAVIRDNKVLRDHLLDRCLEDDLSPADWYEMLNRRVFFWPTKRRLEGLLTARPYRGGAHCVLEVTTAELVRRYKEKISLSPINSGNTLFNPVRRGLSTFMRIPDFSHALLAEVAVDDGIPDIRDFVVSVTEMEGKVRKIGGCTQKEMVMVKSVFTRKSGPTM